MMVTECNCCVGLGACASGVDVFYTKQASGQINWVKDRKR